MIPLALIAAWLGASVAMSWLAGRFIRVGMVDLQRETSS